MFIFLLIFLRIGSSVSDLNLKFIEEKESYRLLKNQLEKMNSELELTNSKAALLAWELSTNSNEEVSKKVVEFGEFRTEWKNNWCYRLKETLEKIYENNFLETKLEPNWIFDKDFNKEFRQFYLLCRGPKYTLHQARELTNILGQLENVYQSGEVCLDDGKCLRGEPDLERIMANSRDPEVLLWAWLEWRNAVGPPSRVFYPSLVDLMNKGAKNNGYNDIGECWREELEVDDLETVASKLYEEIEPFYEALHAVVRYQLNRRYGDDLVSLNEPIPAHLLGNMWAQNWGTLLDLTIKIEPGHDVTDHLQKKNYTVLDLVKRAEDFYVSMGFKPMTEAFWKHSKFGGNISICHGSAANMFKKNDYRMLLCAEVTEEDFYVIHHEMGHIEYYMEYANQLPIFQDGVNSAFQESIGDAIMFGVMSPTHLHRLGLIQDIDQTPGFDIKFLLHQALIKIPQIPFALALEKWRWDVFKGDISPREYNQAWWDLRERYQGVKAPVPRTEKDFDPSSKFHVNDNTPYIRYFISSVLQMQIFESLCNSAIFGRLDTNRTLPLPLHRCDIYGSKAATRRLRYMMSLGSSISWKEGLRLVTGESSYSVRPLLEYYKPLYRWLKLQIQKNNIPVGWN